jgi:hypothetical protein
MERIKKLLSLPKEEVLSIIFRTFYWPSTEILYQPVSFSNANSLSNSMFRYFFKPHLLPATYRGLAAASISAELPSGNEPTTLFRLRISFMIRSSGLLVLMRLQCSTGKSRYDNVS